MWLGEGGKALPLSQASLLPKLPSERNLGATGSSLSPRLGQWFMPKGACVQSLIRVNICLSEPSQVLSLRQLWKVEQINNLLR